PDGRDHTDDQPGDDDVADVPRPEEGPDGDLLPVGDVEDSAEEHRQRHHRRADRRCDHDHRVLPVHRARCDRQHRADVHHHC
ncbi:hypothetical protein C6A85_11040, partial [Mycobacterium sp. ITM-2017-0098]